MKSDRQLILKSGCRVVEKVGFSGLTARAVAKEGKISTQPIYLAFDNMEELREAVKEYIFSVIRTNYFKENKSLSSFLQNYTQFVKDQPELYFAIFLDRKEIRLQSEALFQSFLKECFNTQEEMISETIIIILLSRITGMIDALIKMNEIKDRPDAIEELLKRTVMQDLEIFRECIERN